MGDPAEMEAVETASYFSSVLQVARALNAVLQPAQLNYLIFGNSVPHVHTYLLPRYVDDPCPGLPLHPFVERDVDPGDFGEQLTQLREAAGWCPTDTTVP